MPTMTEKCTRRAYAITHRGTEVEVPCGHYWAGSVVLCDRCERRAEREYPQGWRGYPGDVCRHGVYVGGCGADLMCVACEMGD